VDWFNLSEMRAFIVQLSKSKPVRRAFLLVGGFAVIIILLLQLPQILTGIGMVYHGQAEKINASTEFRRLEVEASKARTECQRH
jgi:H+/Cl- antiporter ClcA